MYLVNTFRRKIRRRQKGCEERRAGRRQGGFQSLTMYSSEQIRFLPGSLRPIVIDGSNVAMAHGQNKVFSSKGIAMVVDHFARHGHRQIVAFLPQFRKKKGQVKDPELLKRMEDDGVVVFTASREVGELRINSYDDAFILDYAARHGGIVISRDNFRDLARKKPEWEDVVRYRILMPTFVGEDDLMWPDDPLGREGPKLKQFLRF